MSIIAAPTGFSPSLVRHPRPSSTTVDRLRAVPSAGLLAPADPDLDVSVVIPFYNPGAALLPATASLVSALELSGLRWEVVAVSDGSTDGSEATIAGLHPQVRVDVAPVNRGKGAALKRGFVQTRGAYVAYLDADGDIGAQHVVAYVRAAMAGGHPVVYADKSHALSLNPSTRYRRLLSRTYSTTVTSLFGIDQRDTQTGCKVLRRDVLADVLPVLHEDGFALDVELFVALSRRGHQGCLGMPVTLNTRMAGSTVGVRAVLRTARDTGRVLRRAVVGRVYEPGAEARVTGSRPVAPVAGLPVGQATFRVGHELTATSHRSAA